MARVKIGSGTDVLRDCRQMCCAIVASVATSLSIVSAVAPGLLTEHFEGELLHDGAAAVAAVRRGHSTGRGEIRNRCEMGRMRCRKKLAFGACGSCERSAKEGAAMDTRGWR